MSAGLFFFILKICPAHESNILYSAEDGNIILSIQYFELSSFVFKDLSRCWFLTCSLFPFLYIEIWYRWNKLKFSLQSSYFNSWWVGLNETVAAFNMRKKVSHEYKNNQIKLKLCKVYMYMTKWLLKWLQRIFHAIMSTLIIWKMIAITIPKMFAMIFARVGTKFRLRI